MLPGGLDILGLFAVAVPETLKASQVKLRQVLNCVDWWLLCQDSSPGSPALVNCKSKTESDLSLFFFCFEHVESGQKYSGGFIIMINAW